MANTTYRSVAAVTLQNRSVAYERIAALCFHLDALGLNLLSLALVSGNFVEVVLNNPLPTVQVAHLGLTGPV